MVFKYRIFWFNIDFVELLDVRFMGYIIKLELDKNYYRIKLQIVMHSNLGTFVNS